MKKLYDTCMEWYKQYQGLLDVSPSSLDSLPLFQKKLFYSEILLIPISTQTIQTIIDSLPDAPAGEDLIDDWKYEEKVIK